MAWARFDDGYARHPKVVAAGPLAAYLNVAGILYSSTYATDGFIAAQAVEGLVDWRAVQGLRVSVPELVAALVRVGLWEKADGGYGIHHFLEYNPSREQVLARRDEQRAHQRQAGLARAARATRNERGQYRRASDAPAEDQPAAGDPAGAAGAALVSSRSSRRPAGIQPDLTSPRPGPSPSPTSASQTRAAAKIAKRGKATMPLPPDLEASCPLDVAAWAKRKLGWDDHAVIHWHTEFVDAVKAGRIKPETSMNGWLHALRNSFRRQVGKRVPRPVSPSVDLTAEKARRQRAAVEGEHE